VLGNALVELGSQFGLDIQEVVQVLETQFPELGDRLGQVVAGMARTQGVENVISDQMMADYIQQAVTKAGGVNAESVGDIVTTAKEYGVTSGQVAKVTGLSEQEVSKTAAQYGYEFNSISDQQITDFIEQAIANAGGINQQSVTEIVNTAKEYGVTSGQVAEVTGLSRQDILDYAEMYGLPAFAKGGYVNQPTIALLGEGQEGEYIIPESKLPQPKETGGVEQLLMNLLQAQQETQMILETMMNQDSQRTERTVSAIRENTVMVEKSAKTGARLMSNKALALQGN
jgi:uncharacterized protein YidB (DUF937 family)